MIHIEDPVLATSLIGIALAAAFSFSVHRRTDSELFSVRRTTELKGLAILAVVFAHIGYLLSDNPAFLFPLSIFAGVAVNLFLFLSGYGRTLYALSHDDSVLKFYREQLPRLYTPFWLAFMVIALFDAFVLSKYYSLSYLLQSALGIFTSANAFSDINSPMWYFTIIVFYYLSFPVFFSRARPWLSAILLYAFTYGIILIEPASIAAVIRLYAVHLVAFPLGMCVAWGVSTAGAKKLMLGRRLREIRSIPGIVGSMALLVIISYLAIHSGVGGTIALEQSISIVTMLLVIGLFVLSRFEFGFLTIFGLYSYEIYLLHWPLISRYDVMYQTLPPAVATLLYLPLLIGIAVVFQKISTALLRKLPS